MNYEEFIKEYNGKSFDYDGVSGIQCVDLAKMYLDKVFNIKPGAWGNAKDYFLNYEKIPCLCNNFFKLNNTPDFVPQKGDIAIWGTGLGQYGHIAIATGEGNTKEFYSYDLNWGDKIVHKVKHNYNGFLGVLRAFNQNLINGTFERFHKYAVYTTQVILKIRQEPSINSKQVNYEELTQNAKEKAFSSGINKGCLYSGVDVTCLDIKKDGEDIWIKIPSGWIAGYYNRREFIK